MDVRAKQRLSFNGLPLTRSCVYSVSLHVISTVRHLYINSKLKIMKNLILVCAIAACFVLTANVKAQRTYTWDSEKILYPTKDFTLLINGLKREIEEFQDYYILNPRPNNNCGNTLNQRIRCRNVAIRARFEKLKTERRVEYSAYRRQLLAGTTCTARSGQNRRCYERLFVPAQHSFMPETLTIFGNGWRIYPTFSPDNSSIVYMIGKAGNGRNYGGFVIHARYSNQGISSLIAAEIAVLRQQLMKDRLPDDLAIDP